MKVKYGVYLIKKEIKVLEISLVKKWEIRSVFWALFFIGTNIKSCFLDPLHLVLDLVNFDVDLVDLGVDLVDLGAFCWLVTFFFWMSPKGLIEEIMQIGRPLCKLEIQGIKIFIGK